MVQVILSTTDSLPGFEVEDILDVIEVASAESPNAISDLVSSLLNFTGGRNAAFDTPVLGAFRDIRAGLREKAQGIGANAVIGIDFEVTEFSSSGSVLVVGVGTAVRVRPVSRS